MGGKYNFLRENFHRLLICATKGHNAAKFYEENFPEWLQNLKTRSSLEHFPPYSKYQKISMNGLHILLYTVQTAITASLILHRQPRVQSTRSIPASPPNTKS